MGRPGAGCRSTQSQGRGVTARLPAAKFWRDEVPPGCPLTPNELSALQGIADGKREKRIALDTGRAHSTIRCHLDNARRRLGVTNTLHAVIHAWKMGWLRVDGIESGAPTQPAQRLTTADRALIQRLCEHEDRIVTPARRVYLCAFDLYVAARTPDEKRAARAIMDTLAPEGGIPTDRPDKHADLVGLLVGYVARERAARRTTARREAA